MTPPEWLWAVKQTHERHSDRMSFMRPISYAMIRTEIWRTNQEGNGTAGHALSLNISSKGLLILMDREPEVDQTMRISVPSAAQEVNIPTMADVRWTRKVPFMSGEVHPFYFVGLRFMV